MTDITMLTSTLYSIHKTDVTIININNIGDIYSIQWKRPEYTVYISKNYFKKTGQKQIYAPHKGVNQ